MLFEGIPEAKRHRFDSLAVEQTLPTTENENGKTVYLNTNHEQKLVKSIYASWQEDIGCDLAVFVKVGSKEECLAEFPKLPIRFHTSDLAQIRVHSVVLLSASPLIRSLVGHFKRKPQSATAASSTPASSASSSAPKNSNNKRSRSMSADSELPKGTSLVPAEILSGDNELSSLTCVALKNSCIDGCAFFRVVQFMYNGRLICSEETISETLRACSFLGVDCGVNLCVEYLLQKLQPKNALSICALANLFNCGRLEELADEYLSEHFEEVTDDVEWGELASDAVHRLLRRDNLKCRSEASVVQALFEWVKKGRVARVTLSNEAKSLIKKDAAMNCGFATDDDADKVIPKKKSEDADDDEEICSDSDGEDDETEENRAEAFMKMMLDGSIRFAHLTDDELVQLTGQIAESPIVASIWNEICKDEMARRTRENAEMETGDESDADESIPNLRRYITARGAQVVNSSCDVYEGHTGYIYAITEGPKGELISGSRDQTIRVWDTKTLKTTNTLDSHFERVFGLIMINGKLASCSFDQTICVWNPETWECEHTLTGHDGWVVALAEVEGKLVSGSADNKLKIWNPETWQSEHTLESHTGHVYGVCKIVDDNGKEFLASGSQDKLVKIYNPSQTWAEVCSMKGHKDEIRSLKQCGKYLASASADRTIRLWFAYGDSVGKPAGMLIGHSDVVETLVSIPTSDDKAPLLASASRDRSIKLWDASRKRCVRTLVGHRNWVKSLYVLSDKRLVSASADRTIRVWDLYL